MNGHEFPVILELNEEYLSYEFNDLLIIQVEKDFYWTQDSGCSCPGRLENHTFPTDFNILNEKTLDSFKLEVSNFPVSPTEKQEFIRKVEDILKQKEN